MKQEGSLEKVKKYDYLNKYNQCQIIQRNKIRSKSRSRSRSPRSLPIPTMILRTNKKCEERTPPKNLSYFHKNQTNNFHHKRSPVDSPRQIFRNIPQISNKLSLQITNQNQILRSQVNQYRIYTTKIQHEIQATKQQISIIRQKYRNQTHIYENNLRILTEQLNLYKYKYQILNEQMRNIAITNQKKDKTQQQTYHNLLIQIMARISSLNNNTIISQYSTFADGNNLQCQLSKIIKETQKKLNRYENLISNLEEMYRKIEKKRSNIELKDIWKWVKKVGKVYDNIQNMRNVIIEKFVQKSSSYKTDVDMIQKLTQMDIDALLEQLFMFNQ